MRGLWYSFEWKFDEMVGDKLRALDASKDPTEFDTHQEWIIFHKAHWVFKVEGDEWRDYENSYAGKTSQKRLVWRQIAFTKKNRDSELLSLEIDYLKDELLQFRVAFMNLLHQQEETLTELEWIEKWVLSPRTRGLITTSKKFIEVTLRQQINDTMFRGQDAERLQKEIEDSKRNSRIVSWIEKWKRYREDIGYSPFHISSGYEGSSYYSSLTER